MISFLKRWKNNREKAGSRNKQGKPSIALDDITQTLAMPLDLGREDQNFQTSQENQTLEVAVCQSIGTRNKQQDTIRFQVNDQGAVCVVCDGMGGLTGGEMASSISADGMLQALLSREEEVPLAMARASASLNEKVKSLRDDQNHPIEAGTTMTAVVVEDHKFFWCSLGDSRIYLWQNGEMEQLNEDNTLGAQLDKMAKEGQITQTEAMQHPKRAALTGYLGMPSLSHIGGIRKALELSAGDIILQCTDGLYRALPPEEICSILREDNENLQEIADKLVRYALWTAGPHDNTSVALTRIKA